MWRENTGEPPDTIELIDIKFNDGHIESKTTARSWAWDCGEYATNIASWRYHEPAYEQLKLNTIKDKVRVEKVTDTGMRIGFGAPIPFTQKRSVIGDIIDAHATPDIVLKGNKYPTNSTFLELTDGYKTEHSVLAALEAKQASEWMKARIENTLEGMLHTKTNYTASLGELADARSSSVEEPMRFCDLPIDSWFTWTEGDTWATLYKTSSNTAIWWRNQREFVRSEDQTGREWNTIYPIPEPTWLTAADRQRLNPITLENNVNRTALLSVGALALATTTDDIALDEITNPEYADSVKAALEKAREEAKSSMTDALVEGLRTVKQLKTTHVASIRSLKARIDSEKSRLDAYDRAWAYGNETGNFVPWFALLGKSYNDLGLSWDDFTRLVLVPENWTAKS